jgi:acyl-CoA reductase-like NAD-dependent aldehyde dehydrogenase
LGVVLREAIGVVSIITPWNFPFLIVGQKLPFALAAGCTAVVKPSELTSGSTLLLGEILTEAGVPDGVVNIITGTGADVGQHMSTHPDVDMVSFTGSTGVGKLTMANAAQTLKKVSLELGGKNPQILFPDADMDAFIDAAVFGAWFNAGECCNAGSRLIVHRSIVDEIVGRVADLSKKVIVGDPLDVSTQVGAIITPQHLSKVGAYVDQAKKAGAAIAHGGDVLDLGLGQYMGPTIIAGVKADMAVAREEVFGPVLSVLSFDTVDEAISIANAVDYGLSAGVWSRDFDTCMNIGRKVRAGTVWINTFMDGTPELPFGGYRQSGLGRELGRHAVEDYTETKTLNMHIGARTGWWMPQGK